MQTTQSTSSKLLPKVNFAESKPFKFPEGFLWGVGVSAHQVEGDTENDWTQWEKDQSHDLSKNFEEYYKNQLIKDVRFRYNRENLERFKGEYTSPSNFVSGKAIEHYKRYKEDLALLDKIGVNLYRFSIEWSRIQPDEKTFDQEAIDYYKGYLRELRDKGIEPMVTLWHWTMPMWLAKKGGTASRSFVFYFERFVQKAVEEFGEYVTYWLTLNEPTVHSAFSYFAGVGPIGKRNLISTIASLRVLIAAHKKAYDIIKHVDPTAQVSIAHHVIPFIAHGNKVINRLTKKLTDKVINYYFLDKIITHVDFLGLNNYVLFEVDKFKRVNLTDRISDMSWELTPESIYHMLKDFQKYGKPILITENGIADHDDDDRVWYIEGVVKAMARAIDEGVDLRGYVYWSFLDNYEWDKGFWPRFGLVEIDYKTMERKVRGSAYRYAEIIKANGLPQSNKQP